MRPCSVSAIGSCEVLPGGSDDLIAHRIEGAGKHCASGLGVSAAAELARERVHINCASAPERNLDLTVPEVAEEQRHLRPGDRARVLDDSIEILGTHLVF